MRIPNLHHVHNEIQEGNKGKQFMNTGSDMLLTSKVREEVTPSLPDPYLLAYKIALSQINIMELPQFQSDILISTPKMSFTISYVTNAIAMDGTT